MTTRRDLLLQQMGIEQWELVHPEIMHGAAMISISPETKLLMVCDEQQSQSLLAKDICRAFAYKSNQIQWINSEQLSRLTVEHTLTYCLFAENEERVQLIKKCLHAEYIIEAESWQQLASNSNQKRALWQKIQKIPHPREYD